MCASTLCPLSSSTLNCVLGSASVTVPSTSMTSSLAKDLRSQTVTRWLLSQTDMLSRPPLPSHPYGAFSPGFAAVLGDYPGAFICDGDGVLEVGGEGAVGGVDRPAVPLAQADLVAPLRDHGLYGEGHAGEEARSGAGPAVVGDLGVLVHLAPYSVGDEISHHPVAPGLGERLYGVPYVPEVVTGASLLCGRLEGPSGRLEEPGRLQGHLADRDRGGGVGHEALVADPDVGGDDVPLLQAVGAGDAVHDHGVGRGADRCREALVALELRPAAVVVDELLGQRVELPRGHAGTDAPAHRLQFGLALADDHDFFSTASRMSSVTSGISCVASTVTRIPLSA